MATSDYPYDGEHPPRPRDDAEHDSYPGSRRVRRQRVEQPIAQQTSIVGILAMVIGGIGLSISVIPCVGVLGMIGGGLGLILGLIAIVEARSSGGRVGLGAPVAGTIISLVGFLIGGAWLLFMTGLFRNNQGVPGNDGAVVDGPPLKVSAVELDREFDADEATADTKYQGKWVEVTGQVKRVLDTHEPGKVRLELVGNADSAIHCLFPMTEKAELDLLEPDKEVVIRGRCKGLVLGSVSLEDCTRVLSDKEKEAKSVPPIRLLAAILASEYGEDMKAANAKYRWKMVDVTGLLGKVSRDKPGKVIVQLDDDAGDPLLTCEFSTEDAKSLAMFKAGKRVTIRGRCLGNVDDTLTVGGCTLVK